MKHRLTERPDLAAAFKLFGNAASIGLTAALADVYSLAAALGIGAERRTCCSTCSTRARP